MTSGIRKETEEHNDAHITCFLYKLIKISKDCDSLSIGLHGGITTREEMTTNRTTNGIYRVEKNLNDVFGFAEDQEKGTYGLGYTFNPQRRSDLNVLGHELGADQAAKIATAGKIVTKNSLVCATLHSGCFSTQSCWSILYTESQHNHQTKH